MHLPTTFRLALVILVAAISGVMNSIAGGGTLLTFPALVGLGISPIVANGTSTVALWPAAPRPNHARPPSPAGTCRWDIGSRRRERCRADSDAPAILHPLLPVLVSIYGGYFGAGVGILMLAALGFMGLTNIHRMNGLKNWGGLCMNAVAALLFGFRRLVSWPVALTMAVGAMAGGYTVSRVAQRVGQRGVRLHRSRERDRDARGRAAAVAVAHSRRTGHTLQCATRAVQSSAPSSMSA